MKTILTPIKSIRILVFFLLLFICTVQLNNKLYAQAIGITINGQVSGSIIQQGGYIHWIITGLSNGAVVTNEFWIDKDNDGVINSSIDLLFVQFQQTDGFSGNDGPGDEDGLANGTINTNLQGEYFPVANYILKTTSGSSTAQATCTITALQNTTYSVSGSVKKAGVGMRDIVVQINLNAGNGEYFALTNSLGNYTIQTDIATGTSIEIKVPTSPFNSVLLAGLLVSPNKITSVLTSSIANANFTVSAGKVITGVVKDGSNNPIQGYDVNVMNASGGNNNYYYGQTNSNGTYAITVDIGDYKVCFGTTNSPTGNLLTYYNQKNLSANSDIINVTSNVDSIKNINATIYKGALITGTFTQNGQPIQGMIYASNYSTPQTRIYESWYNADNGNYYLYVLPGTYSINFQQNGSSTNGLYYNQSSISPGTAVVVNSVNDVISNINVNFTNTVPVVFSSITAILEKKQVLIKWSVSTEVNVKNYVIERSSNGISFNTIGTIAAIGISNYSFTDVTMLEGINFYRIKAVDNDGSCLYSSIAKINYTKNAQDFIVYPNPVFNSVATLQLTGFEKGTYQLKLYNALGQVVYIKHILVDIDKLLYNMILPVKGINKIEISGKDTKLIKTVVVQ